VGQVPDQVLALEDQLLTAVPGVVQGGPDLRRRPFGDIRVRAPEGGVRFGGYRGGVKWIVYRVSE
ncbi:MAG: hypothetical protein M3Y35_10870, partial [Actinomycetota bacterium]|nr:hypothetical protein [Actinomycetota bacterium]